MRNYTPNPVYHEEVALPDDDDYRNRAATYGPGFEGALDNAAYVNSFYKLAAIERDVSAPIEAVAPSTAWVDSQINIAIPSCLAGDKLELQAFIQPIGDVGGTVEVGVTVIDGATTTNEFTAQSQEADLGDPQIQRSTVSPIVVHTVVTPGTVTAKVRYRSVVGGSGTIRNSHMVAKLWRAG